MSLEHSVWLYMGELEKLVGNSQDPFKLAMSSASYALYSQKQLGVFFFLEMRF